MTPATQLPDNLSRTLNLIERAAKAGSALTYDQLRLRLGHANNGTTIRFVKHLRERGLVILDNSTRPTVVMPARKVA